MGTFRPVLHFHNRHVPAYEVFTMMRNPIEPHTTVEVEPMKHACDFCREQGVLRQAKYDAATAYGPWANMCEDHWREHGNGKLGLGKGQMLVIREKTVREQEQEREDEYLDSKFSRQFQ